MNRPQEALLAYISTLICITVLTVTAALIVALAPMKTSADIARIIGSLGFISAAVTGLIGVIGTFRPKGHNEGSGQ